MTFKAAICPSCGGALQASADGANIKCMYCGVDLIVSEDTQSAAGRIEELMRATPVKASAPASRFVKAIIGCGALALLFSIVLLAQPGDKNYGAILMVVSLVLIMTGITNL